MSASPDAPRTSRFYLIATLLLILAFVLVAVSIGKTPPAPATNDGTAPQHAEIKTIESRAPATSNDIADRPASEPKKQTSVVLSPVEAEVARVEKAEKDGGLRWDLVLDENFDKGLPEDFEASVVPVRELLKPGRIVLPAAKHAPKAVVVRDGMVHMDGKNTPLGRVYVILRWKKKVGPNLRVELTTPIPDNQGACISPGGDGLRGHRVIVTYDHNMVNLDSIQDRQLQGFAQAKPTFSYKVENRIQVADRVGDLFRVSFDGERVIDYLQPAPLPGPREDTIALSVHCGRGAVDRIRVWNGVWTKPQTTKP